ncbi:ATP-binding protein [Streptomyces sioyaensis]|uniref:ATP-binding protein n=1 Tax=Streptomyces sioyaensis TaxID=67364 RepID=UPI00369C82FF
MSPATAVAPASTKQRPLVSRAFEVATSPDPRYVSGIRHDTAVVLRQWDVPPTLAYDVVLVVSELVANAIEHGLGGVSLRVGLADGDLRIEVSDDSPDPARLRAAGDYDVSGRGLFLVAALALDWGVSANCKTTWATFRLPAGRA